MLFIISMKWKYLYHENIPIFIDTEMHFYIADLVTYSSSVFTESWSTFAVWCFTSLSWRNKMKLACGKSNPPSYFLFLSLEVICSHKEVNGFFLAVVRSHRITAWEAGGASGCCPVPHPCSQQVAQVLVPGWDLSISRGWRFQGICNIFPIVLLWCINCMAILLTQNVYLGLLTCCPSVGYTARSTCEFSRFLKLWSISWQQWCLYGAMA